MFQIYHRPLLGIATCSLATLVSTPLTASGDDAFEYTHVEWANGPGANGHWYVQVKTAPAVITWDGAYIMAEEMGGHLVTITSAEEDNLVHESFAGCITSWAGGVRSGEWQWITGEPWSYTNWYPGEPNGSDGSHLEVIFKCDGWNDMYASYQRDGFIVEFEADCNNDGIVDYGQILDGSLSDHDGDGIPDCCTQGNCDCPADLNQDRIVNGMDLSVVLGFWGTDAEAFPAADLNHDGVVDGVDLTILLGAWGSDCS